MDRIDIIMFGMLIMVIMGIFGMYIHAIDLAGVVTIEGLAVAVSIGAAQLQKYSCQVCNYLAFANLNIEKYQEFLRGKGGAGIA